MNAFLLLCLSLCLLSPSKGVRHETDDVEITDEYVRSLLRPGNIINKRRPADTHRDESFLELSLPHKSSVPRKWSKYISVVRVLGEGSFGKVSMMHLKCCDNNTCPDRNSEVVMKHIPREAVDRMGPAAADNERKAQLALQGKSDYIVSLVSRRPFLDRGRGGHFYLMELLNEGEYFPILTEYKKVGVHPAMRLALFLQIVRGVQIMHSEGLLHLDVKAENAMVNCHPHDQRGKFRKKKQRCYAAVIDFGFTTAYKKGDELQTGHQIVGTGGHFAPEVARGKHRGPWNDVWSLGVVLHRVLLDDYPSYWNMEDEVAEIKGLFKFHANTDSHVQSVKPEAMKFLLETMLHQDWDKRPGLDKVEQIIAHRLRSWANENGEGFQQILDMVNLMPSKYGAKREVASCIDEIPPRPFDP